MITVEVPGWIPRIKIQVETLDTQEIRWKISGRKEWFLDREKTSEPAKERPQR